MRLLLVRPRPDPETIGLQHLMVCEPLELEWLAAAVRDLGVEVRLLDQILDRRPLEPLLRELRPDLVAVTGYITHVRRMCECCRAVKRVLPRCVTVAGGVHAEVVPEDFADDAIDVVVRSHALETFRAVVAAVARGGDPRQPPGVWRPDRPRPARNPPTLTHLRPDRTLTREHRARYHYLFHQPCALLKTSFGCPHHCTFCFCREIPCGGYYERDLGDVLAELAGIEEREVYIVDDNFLVSAERVLRFCQGLREAGIDKRYLVYGRADFIAANEEVVAAFAAAGLRAVIVGLESCEAADLERYRKEGSVEANEAAVQVLARQGVDCYATLILGEHWDRADFRRLRNWLRRLDLLFVNLQPFTPLPGTAPFAAYRERLRIPRRDAARWDLAHLVVHPTRLTPRRYYAGILGLYLATALRPAHLPRLISRFGLRAVLRLSRGAARIAGQYIRLALGSESNRGAP